MKHIWQYKMCTAKTICLAICCFVFFLIGGEAYAQTNTVIQGKVIDETGSPMIGVTVAVEGTTTGTMTDDNGNYSLQSAQGFTPAQIITFSFIGYEKVTEKTNGRQHINITMNPVSVEFDDVVVIGYGTVKRGAVTSAVSALKTSEMPKSSTASLGSMLAGRASGLIVQQTSAAPGGALNFSIRGGGTPLIVIDGVPMSPLGDQYLSENKKETGNKLASVPTDNNFINLNPEDIKSIDILKDASATAIYGSRAANGVVLITTKRGTESKVQVSFSASASLQKMYGMPEMLQGQDYMRERNKIAREIWMNNNNVYPYGTRQWTDFMNNDVAYPYTEAEIAAFTGGTNWIDEVTRDGFLHNESLNVTGGSEKTQYLFSMSNLDNKAVIKGNDFNRFTMRLNLDQKFNNWIKGNVSLSFSRNKLDNIYGEGGRSGGAQFAGVIASSLEFNPVLPIRDEDGKYVLNPDRTNRPNPVSFLDAQDKSKRDDIFGTASIELTPIKNLMIKGTVGANLRNNERKSYLPSTISIGNQASMYAYIGENKNENYLVNLLADYKFNLGEKHSFGIMGAFEYENKEQFGKTMVNSDFPSDDFLWNNMGAGAMTRPEVTSYLIGEERASYIARFNYAFNNKYLLTANLRVDGSSNFAENKQWGVFPGVSAAWRITEEPFLQNNKVINDLKLRAGYGRVGNDGNLTGTYSYLGTKYYAFNKIPTAGLGMEKIGNPDLSWETKDNYNVGLDWGLFKGRLSGSVDFYYSRITNLIGQRQLPINMEVNTMDYNLSQVDGNKGVDLNISSVNFHNKDFKWSTDIVFSYYRNFYIRRDANYVLGINEKQRQDKGEIWQYEIDGLVPAGETNAGAIKVKDVNGYLRDENGNIVMVNGKPAYSGSPDGKIDEADLQHFGNSTPIPFSINNSFEYKNFDLNIYLYGMLNNWQSNATYRLFSGNMENVYTYGENTLAKLKNRWSYDNMNSTTPSIFATAVSSGQVQRFYYEKASFLRCENITLGYTLPKKLTSKVFSSVRLYATARNLFVITPYSGSDPETDSQAAYPNQRTYTFGIDIKF